MSGATLSSVDLDPRRRRILVRAWRRGLKEMDLIYGGFANARLPALSDGDLDALEALMEEADRDVFAWISGEAVVPPEHRTALFEALRDFHTHAAPLHR